MATGLLSLSGGTGVWYNTSLSLNQFKYDYVAGQWYDEGKFGSWAMLGPSGLSASFVGDPSPHYLDSNWSYNYSYSYQGGSGSWNTTNHGKFHIQLQPWSLVGYDIHVGSTEFDHWGGFSAAFIGDGAWHDVGVLYNDTHWHEPLRPIWWWLRLLVQEDLGLLQYKYSYDTGQWWTKGGMATGGLWVLVICHLDSWGMAIHGPWTATGPIPSAVGSVIGRIQARIFPNLSMITAPVSGMRKANIGGWATLGTSGLSSTFLGDGGWHLDVLGSRSAWIR